MNIKESPYAEFLEEAIRALLGFAPVKIGLIALDADKNYLSAYYGDCDSQDKGTMGFLMQQDGMLDAVKVNMRWLQEEEEDYPPEP